MNRITPAQVVAAFAQTGATPAQCVFGPVAFTPDRDPDNECDAIYALLAAQGWSLDCRRRIVDRVHLEQLGIGNDYRWGFVHGWDCAVLDSPSIHSEAWLEGFEDGVACWRAVDPSPLAVARRARERARATRLEPEREVAHV